MNNKYIPFEKIEMAFDECINEATTSHDANVLYEAKETILKLRGTIVKKPELNKKPYVQIEFPGITLEEQELKFENADAAINYTKEFDIKRFQLFFYDENNSIVAFLECSNTYPN